MSEDNPNYKQIHTDIYIHRLPSHIGFYLEGKQVTGDRIRNALSESRQAAIKLSKKTYSDFFTKSLEKTEIKNAAEEILDNKLINKNKETVIKAIEQGIQDTFASSNLQTAFDAFSSSDNNFSNNKSPYEQLVETIKDRIKNDKRDLIGEDLENFFYSLEQVYREVFKDEDAVKALMLLIKPDPEQSFPIFEGDRKPIGEAVNSIYRFIENAKNMPFLKNEKGKIVLNENSLRTSLKSGFLSTGLGELAIIIQNAAKQNANKAIQQGLTSIRGTGTGVVESKLYIGKKNEEYITLDSKRMQKIDSLVDGIFTMDINGETITISIKDIGLSIKTYSSSGFKKNQTISLGGAGMSLKQAIDNLQISGFNNGDIGKRYLLYNVTAHHDNKQFQYSAAFKELQDLIIRRYIVNFMVSRGGANDFAQFLIINGQVYSTYELINQLLDSEKNYYDTFSISSDQAISLSYGEYHKILNKIPSLAKRKKNQKNMLNSENAISRSLAVINEISKVRLLAKLHLDKLAKAANTNTITGK